MLVLILPFFVRCLLKKTPAILWGHALQNPPQHINRLLKLRKTLLKIGKGGARGQEKRTRKIIKKGQLLSGTGRSSSATMDLRRKCAKKYLLLIKFQGSFTWRSFLPLHFHPNNARKIDFSASCLYNALRWLAHYWLSLPIFGAKMITEIWLKIRIFCNCHCHGG